MPRSSPSFGSSGSNHWTVVAVGKSTRYLMAPRLRAAYRFDVRLLSRSRDRNPLSCSVQCIRTKIFRKPREQWGREYCNQNSRNLDKARAPRAVGHIRRRPVALLRRRHRSGVKVDESPRLSLLAAGAATSSEALARAVDVCSRVLCLDAGPAVFIRSAYANTIRLEKLTEQCIAGWKDANNTIQRLRASR